MDTPSKKQILRYAQDDNFNSSVFMKHALEREVWGRALKRTSGAKAYGVVTLYGTTKVVLLTKGGIRPFEIG
jgi:hypothetical protein